MRKIFATFALVALALLGLGAPAQATTVGVPATEGSWSTTQTLTVGSDSHSFTYDYTVSYRGANQQWFELTKACHTGPSSAGYPSGQRSWNPQVSVTLLATTSPLSSSSGWTGAAGNGIGNPIASSVSSGTTCISKGDPGTSNWGKVTLANGSTPSGSATHGPLLKSWIGGSGSNNAGSSALFDMSTNVAPTPTDITGSFSMDFHCWSPANSAYESFWTWYYTVSGTNPNWTLTTTGLTKNVETAGATTDLHFGSNPHIINGDVITFTWASGAPPTADLVADWGGGISCSVGPNDLIANF